MNSKIELRTIQDSLKKVNDLDTDHLLVVLDQNIPQVDFSSLTSKVSVYSCVGGEQCKDLDVYKDCLSFFLKEGAHRKSYLLAIGGGTISDLAGFVASTLLRGVRWSAIPTTLLSMVDASIGGKTGVNMNEGKNLVGTFHLPENVWIDLSFLNTLEKKEIWSGKGEVFKYCFLSPELREMVLSDRDIQDIVLACANFKNDIVEKDFEEAGLRKTLNLGHTFGHAIEKGYRVEHGVSVIIGLLLIIHLYCDKNVKSDALKILKKLDVDLPDLNSVIDVDSIYNYILHDKKKVSHREIDLIVPNANEAIVQRELLSNVEKNLFTLRGSDLNDLLLR